MEICRLSDQHEKKGYYNNHSIVISIVPLQINRNDKDYQKKVDKVHFAVKNFHKGQRKFFLTKRHPNAKQNYMIFFYFGCPISLCCWAQ